MLITRNRIVNLLLFFSFIGFISVTTPLLSANAIGILQSSPSRIALWRLAGLRKEKVEATRWPYTDMDRLTDLYTSLIRAVCLWTLPYP